MKQNSQTLLDTLRAKQQSLGLDNTAFAARLGISRPLWVMVLTGQKSISLRLLQGVTRVFPDLDHLVLAFLRGE